MDTNNHDGNSTPQAIDSKTCPDITMALIQHIASDDVKPKSTTTSNMDTSISLTNLLSIIEIPLLLEKVLDIVHCPILHDTMITPAYGKTAIFMIM